MIACQSYLWTAGDAGSPLRAQIADAVVVIAVGLPLVPIIGVLGLAIGGVACAIAHTAILARAVDRQTHVNVVRHIGVPVLAWTVAAGAAWGCAEGPGSACDTSGARQLRRRWTVPRVAARDPSRVDARPRERVWAVGTSPRRASRSDAHDDAGTGVESPQRSWGYGLSLGAQGGARTLVAAVDDVSSGRRDLPRNEFESRTRLFTALEQAIGLSFTPDPSPLVVATVMLGDACPPGSEGLPTLRLVHPEPALHAPAPVRLADSAWLDAALRGQVLSDGFAAETAGLSPSPRAKILASGEGRVFWTHDPSAAEERAAVVPRELAVGETLRNRLRPGAVLPLLPLASFLLRVAEASGLRRAPLRATFLIDDPNLHRPRYGYLDFAELAARSSAEGWHMAFATIPMDGWFVDQRVARLFMRPEPHLSLLIHGNRHVKCELARLTDDNHALREMSQALNRIRRLEARTGLKVSRVIAPPHGVYAPIAARALARLQVGALCISNPYPWLESDAPRPPLAGWRPAEFLEGLPIVPRHHLVSDPEELVLRAFLRQPLVVYGHHTDAADGLGVFSDAARRVDSLGDVRWMDPRRDRTR